ncbi:hypothetical protein HMPREF3034_02058 [Prevotella sp. DNF00663]|uniref:Uncharacterized protein n=1 Tax=Prevotella bivia TaxID=28125 RepID=A0A137SSV2_9BACT|nr:hypothetical protein HMPREF3034_02058 [Prevotella sp. DNF00663]KXO15486.1 hypothetical protein HMPREF3202_01713 [Prevotella bivia]
MATSFKISLIKQAVAFVVFSESSILKEFFFTSLFIFLIYEWFYYSSERVNTSE